MEAGEVSRPQAELSGPAEDLDASISRRHLPSHLAGAIGRVVIDDEHVAPGGVGQDLVNEGLDVLELVVGGHHDQGVLPDHGHATTSPVTGTNPSKPRTCPSL